MQAGAGGTVGEPLHARVYVSPGLAQHKPSLGAEKCAQKAPKSVTFSGSAYSVKEPRHGGKCHVRHVRAGAGGT